MTHHDQADYNNGLHLLLSQPPEILLEHIEHESTYDKALFIDVSRISVSRAKAYSNDHSHLPFRDLTSNASIC